MTEAQAKQNRQNKRHNLTTKMIFIINQRMDRSYTPNSHQRYQQKKNTALRRRLKRQQRHSHRRLRTP